MGHWERAAGTWENSKPGDPPRQKGTGPQLPPESLSQVLRRPDMLKREPWAGGGKGRHILSETGKGEKNGKFSYKKRFGGHRNCGPAVHRQRDAPSNFLGDKEERYP